MNGPTEEERELEAEKASAAHTIADLRRWYERRRALLDPDYEQLALAHQDALQRLGWLEGREHQRKINMERQSIARLKARYRKRITRLELLLRERKSPAGWLHAKWRRMGAR